MCGICGFVGRADGPLVESMNAVLAHRGPDGEGVKLFEGGDGRVPAALGHRRLSILDTSPRGAQPMGYAAGRYWITYNGELYNFRALRSDLEAEGFTFESECDTEVLLAMYARYGEAMLDRLNGIFAFAIWDRERSELFLARDRLGVKPLYYAEHGDVLYFASELKSLLRALPRPSVRHAALAEYLTFLWVPDPGTLFEGMHQLPAGHCARYAGARLAVREYWDVDFQVDPASSEVDWAERVRETAQESIRRQMVSDVPLGSFLSGGIDSSAIVAEMTAVAGDVTAYSVGFSAQDLSYDISPDDLRYARSVAKEFGVDYHEQLLEPRIVDLLPRLVRHLDDPIADPAAVTTYLICSAASERLKVILSGMGGDEVFAGYPRYPAARIAGLADVIPAPLRRAMRTASEGRLTLGPPGRLRPLRRNLMKLLRGIDQSPQDRYLVYCSYYRPEELQRLLHGDLRAALETHDPFRYHRAYFERVRDQSWLNQMLYVDAKTFLPCLNLAYTDKMSMAASTEVRVPLLDDEVVSHAARIPPNLKLHRLTRKYVFKRSMEGILPRDVIWRPKAGFGAPIRGWLVNELRPMIDDVLSPETVAARGLFDPGEIKRLVTATADGTEDNALRLWALLTLELWQQAFVDGSA